MAPFLFFLALLGSFGGAAAQNTSIARGQTERNGNLGIAPPTSTMYKLRYDCNAESYAQQHVNTCDGRNQPDAGHPGYKENVNVLNRQSDFAGAAQWVIGYGELVGSTGHSRYQDRHTIYRANPQKKQQEYKKIH
ncbi:hypothetical protein ANCDUO_02745 [Ancylostoma duodenale]|uniref:SCP domain-containing protein n=1 Tax=Ancylostoma duodenale TaxID=51022 RepID=A0A0C2GZL9_9BILA|nr:hypothetical protein ANCDUO_02745 [Ancylostoma duodenale]